MKSRSLRVTPHKEPSSSARSTALKSIPYFPKLSLRSVRSSITHISAECSSEDDGDVVVSNDDGTEVMRQRDASTLLELGHHEYTMKRFDDAIDCWNEALQLSPDATMTAQIFSNLLMVYLELNQTSPSDSYERDAKHCFDQLRPHLSSWTPSYPSPLVLEYFIEHGEWEGAVRLANLIIVDKAVMARIHYERGIQPSASPSLRMECMKKCLSCEPPQRLKLAAHAELVQLYSMSESYSKALEHHEERLQFLENDLDIAKAFFEEGELHLSLGATEKAMHSIEKGLALCPDSLTLIEAKADLCFLLGRVEESLSLHESILKRTEHPAERSKVLYTMGRICHKSGLEEKAVAYYKQELEITQQTLGENHLECSRIYHELATIADEACSYRLALQYLEQALAIEKLHLSQLSGERRREVSTLCRGTQKLIGKIHFKTGNFDQALSSSFADLTCV